MVDKKRAQEMLGIPFGTANARLNRILLFDLLKRHEENVCFRCSTKIEQLEQLSIEHKNPWMGVGADLFWDLDNVAWSHRGCNSRESMTRMRARQLGVA